MQLEAVSSMAPDKIKERLKLFDMTKRPHVSVLVCILIGFFLTSLYFWQIRQSQLHIFNTRFESDTYIRTELIRESLDDSLVLAKAVKQFFEAAHYPNRDHFSKFILNFITENEEIRAVKWTPVVKNNGRAAFEAGGSAELGREFGIYEMGASGKPIYAAERDTYYPVYFVEPMDMENIVSLGFDMGSTDERRKALEHAAETGLPVVCENNVVAGNKGMSGLALFVPVYKKAITADAPGQRRGSLVGFGMVLFRMDVIVSSALNNISDQGISFNIIDPGADADKRIKLRWESRAEKQDRWWLFLLPDPPAVTHRFKFAERECAIEYRADSSYMVAYYPMAYWYIIPTGILLSLLFPFYLHVIISQKKRFEYMFHVRSADLQEHEKRFNDLIEQAAEAILIYDADLNLFVDANLQAERMFGCGRDELLMSNPARFFLDEGTDADKPEDKVHTMALEALQGGNVFYEHPAIGLDGRIFSAEFRMVRLATDGRNLLRMSYIDLTDRGKSAGALKSQDENYRKIFENAMYGIYRCTMEGKYLIVNAAMARMHGYDSQEKMILSVHDIGRQVYLFPEERKRFLELIIRFGFTNGFETRFRRKNGEVFWVSINAYLERDIDGNILYIEGTNEDITSRKLAEEALRKWASIFEYSGWGIAICEPVEKRIDMINPAFATMYGLPAGDIIGRRIIDFVASDFKVVVPQRFLDVLESGTHSFESKHVRADGTEFHVLVSISAINDNAGSVLYFAVNVQDITKQKLTEEALFKQRLDLQSANDELNATNDEFETINQELLDSNIRLLESENRYKALIDSAADAIMVISDGRFIDCNLKSQDLLGYPRERILGESPVRFSPEFQPDGRNSAEKAMKNINAVLEGKPLSFLWTHMRSNGELFESDVTLNRFEAGSEYYILVIMRDLTETKRAQKMIQRERSQARVYLDIVPVMMIALDQNGEVTMINRKGREIIEYTESEVLGKNWFDLCVPAEDREEVRGVFRMLVSGDMKLAEYHENQILTKSGERRMMAFHNRYMRDSDNKFTGVLSSGEDITERKRAEEALRESEARYRRISDAITDYIYTVKVDSGKAAETRHGAGCKPVTGYSEEEFAADQFLWYNMVHPDDRSIVQEQAELILQGRTKTAIEHRIVRKDGVLRWVRNTVVPRYNGSGLLVSYDGLIQDITDRKKAEEAKEKLEDQLRQAQKMEAIGQLAGGIAHDFNNLLTAIIGYGNLLSMEIGDDSPLKEYVEHIMSSAEKSANLTRQLLAFSRKQIISPKNVDFNELIMGIGKLLKRIVSEDIEILLRLSDENLVIMADPGQMEQVVMNLCANARDAMPGGGEIRITTESISMDEDDIDLLGMSIAKRYARVMIRDTGTGMDEATMKRIFEPFFTTKEVGKGTGLGLSIVYGIIKQHSGSINVYSEVGKGTTFEIFVPLVDLPKDDELKLKSEAPRGGNETILLAEDSEDLRTLTVHILQEYGYNVIDAIDGQDAIDKFRANSNSIDLVILDVIMPKKNGKEAYEEIYRIKQQVKALFISGYTSDIIHTRGILDEDVNFISKPLTPSELLCKIRDILDKVRI